MRTTTKAEGITGNKVEIKQALVGFDLTDTDTVIADYLAFLSAAISIKALRGAHVVPSFDLYNALFFGDKGEIEGVYLLNEDIHKRMKQIFEQSFNATSKPGWNSSTSEGDPLEEIIDIALEVKPDLVVIGKKVQENSYGILPKNLIRKINCDALVIPEKVQHRLETILVPIDFSSYSIKALEKAIQIAATVEKAAKVIAIHVFTLPNIQAFRSAELLEEYKQVISKNMRDTFELYIEKYKVPNVEVDLVLVDRPQPGTAKYILENAKMYDADLIMMGIKGHSKVELLLMGSVTEKLLSINNSIPTLVIKEI